MRVNGRVFIALLLSVLFIPLAAHSEQGPSKQEVLTALRKAAEFYVTKIASHGGYHAMYSGDLSYKALLQGWTGTNASLCDRSSYSTCGAGLSASVGGNG